MITAVSSLHIAGHSAFLKPALNITVRGTASRSENLVERSGNKSQLTILFGFLKFLSADATSCGNTWRGLVGLGHFDVRGV